MSNPEFLLKSVDPLAYDDCGSLVIGLIVKPEVRRQSYGAKRPWKVECSATLKLTDCNRYIEWSFSNDDDIGFDVEKAEALERAVVTFVAQLREAQKMFVRAQKEAKTRNKNEGLKDE